VGDSDGPRLLLRCCRLRRSSRSSTYVPGSRPRHHPNRTTSKSRVGPTGTFVRAAAAPHPSAERACRRGARLAPLAVAAW
jgi:hypothetical protein